MKRDFQNIDGSEKWSKIEKINTGWSYDKKFYIETSTKQKLLLRLTTYYLLYTSEIVKSA